MDNEQELTPAQRLAQAGLSFNPSPVEDDPLSNNILDAPTANSRGLPTAADVRWLEASEHLNNVVQDIMKYSGIKDHNPYIMLRELNIPEMQRLLKRKEYSDVLYASIMNLKRNLVPHVSNLKSIPQYEY